ncbi:MAG: SPOR domain-containing protein [Sphingomonadales bacterium]|nr:SPOR domain-containing protein [Sphingomonadales bacterium]
MAAGDENGIEGEAPHTWEAEAEGEPLETERLAFDEDEHLPWLDSGDEEYGEYESADTGRILGFVILGLIALAAIVGGIWWASHRTPDPALVADGSTIDAPVDPYKEAPKHPGGKTFDGTGDSSFAVSEGQNRPARLGQESPAASASGAAAKPGAATAPGKPGAAPAAAVAAPATGGVGVQVGAYSSQSAAEAGWSHLSQAQSALSGLHHRVLEGKADIGTVYRLQAVTADAAAANALCGRLKAAGVACQVKN